MWQSTKSSRDSCSEIFEWPFRKSPIENDRLLFHPDLVVATNLVEPLPQPFLTAQGHQLLVRSSLNGCELGQLFAHTLPHPNQVQPIG